MKALALRQPWAELLVAGQKTIEVRAKNTTYRGWFYVYASRSGTREEVLRYFGFTELPTGVIIGQAFLNDVKHYGSDAEFSRDTALHLATPELLQAEQWPLKEKYGYVITKTRRIRPIPTRGMPGFFPVPNL